MRWVEQNKRFIGGSLAGGVLFFSLLAGIAAWRNTREKKSQEFLFQARADKAKLSKLIQKFSSSTAANFARMELGDYEALYQHANANILFRVMALHQMGRTLEENGDFEKGCAHYDRAAKEPGHLAPWFSIYEKSRCLKAAGDPKAKKIFETLLLDKTVPADFKERIEEEWILAQLPKS